MNKPNVLDVLRYIKSKLPEMDVDKYEYDLGPCEYNPEMEMWHHEEWIKDPGGGFTYSIYRWPKRESEITVAVPARLLNNLLKNTYEIKGERYWSRGEPRYDYQKNLSGYVRDVHEAEAILRQLEEESITTKK